MFLRGNKLIDFSIKQYIYKVKSNITLLNSLIIVQAIAIFFSIGGVMGRSAGFDFITVNLRMFSGDIIWGLTLFWVLAITVNATTKYSRDVDFTFVSNRLSSSIATILYILTFCLIGSCFVLFGNYLLRAIALILFNNDTMAIDNFRIPLNGVFFTIFIVFLYYVFFSSLTYFTGVLIQLKRIFIVIIPSILISLLVIETKNYQHLRILSRGFNFVLNESNLMIFTIKIILTSILVFAFSSLISNRLEVRR